MAAAPSYMTREKLASLLQSELAGTIAIVDVRDSDYIGGHIKGAQNVPSSSLDYRLPELVRKLEGKSKVVFHCALSQQRGPAAARRYHAEKQRAMKESVSQKNNEESSSSSPESAAGNEQEIYILDGGFNKWQEK